jgi:AraC-like DNA-binding protein
LYTAAMTNMLPVSKKIWVLHFLPFILLLLIKSPFFFLSMHEKKEILNSPTNGYKLPVQINNYAILVSGIFYVAWLFVLLNKHKKNIASQFSYDEKIKLNWLRYLMYGLGIIWAIVIAQAVNAKSYDHYIFGIVVLIIVVIGYFGIRQGRIYNNTVMRPLHSDLENNLKDEQLNSNTNAAAAEIQVPGKIQIYDLEKKPGISAKRKYANSGLTEASSQYLYDKLKLMMVQEQFYKDPELTLASLAEKLDIYPNHLSQIINEKEGKSFYDYINTLRVEEIKQQLLIPQNNKFTMMGLAADCGFNSKSSFNKNFKKITGQTPSEYLNKKG